MNLSEKFASPDHDFRYMAINDLLSKPSEADAYVPTILKLALTDSNDQVSSLACRLLGVVVRADNQSTPEIFKQLCGSLSGDQFDYAMLGLKICLADLKQGVNTGAVTKMVVGALVQALSSQELQAVSQSSKLADVLQVLAEVLSNPKMKQYIAVDLYQNTLIQALLPQVQSSSVGTTKRASVALAALSDNLSSGVYASLVGKLMDGQVASLNTLSLLATNPKFEPFVQQAYQLVIKQIPNIEEYEDDVEVDKVEASLLLISSLVPRLNNYFDICDLALQWIDFDPNRVALSDDDQMQVDDEQEDQSEDEDDDDESWKLRRISAQLLQALFVQKFVPNDSQLQKLIKSLNDIESVKQYKLAAIQTLESSKDELNDESLSRKRKSIDADMDTNISEQYKQLDQQSDIQVHRDALAQLVSQIHKNSHQLRSLFPEILPYLLKQTHIRSDLIQVIEVGIFKHQIDNGLEARKLAYDCLYASQSVSDLAKLVPAAEYGKVMVSAIKDSAYEIKSLGVLMLLRMTELQHQHPSWMQLFETDVEFMDSLLGALSPHITPTIKNNAIKSDVEKLNDFSEQACRGLLAVSRLLAVVCVKADQLELCPDQVKETRIKLYTYLETLKKQPAQWKLLNKVQ